LEGGLPSCRTHASSCATRPVGIGFIPVQKISPLCDSEWHPYEASHSSIAIHEQGSPHWSISTHDHSGEYQPNVQPQQLESSSSCISIHSAKLEGGLPSCRTHASSCATRPVGIGFIPVQKISPLCDSEWHPYEASHSAIALHEQSSPHWSISSHDPSSESASNVQPQHWIGSHGLNPTLIHSVKLVGVHASSCVLAVINRIVSTTIFVAN